MFLGREKELGELNRLYQQNRFQLFIIYGRRRVGKTTLLKEFCKGKKSIFFSAEQSNEKMNLEKFSSLVFQFFHEEALEPFSTWENAILYINKQEMDEPLIVVLDEFPYLADINAGLLSMLQHLIDHKLKEKKLFLILCGSYVGFMEKEVLGVKSPLFGRRTAQLHMKSFDYKMSAEFMSGFSLEEKILLYGSFGGSPMYLQQISNEHSFVENIRYSFLQPTGYLYEEPLLLLRQELQEPGIYNAIIEAIARGAVKINEISLKIGEDSAKCLKYIAILRELGIIYKEIPLGEKESSRKSQYGISDTMFRFWYRYVGPNKTLIETDAWEIVMQKRIMPDLSNYMGLVYEKVCKEFLLRRNSKGMLPILFTEIGRWWGNDPKQKKEVEIDLIAKEQNHYLFCECKWRNEKVDYSVLKNLREKSELFHCERKVFALFSKKGFADKILEEAEQKEDLLLFQLPDLFD